MTCSLLNLVVLSLSLSLSLSITLSLFFFIIISFCFFSYALHFTFSVVQEQVQAVSQLVELLGKAQSWVAPSDSSLPFLHTARRGLEALEAHLKPLVRSKDEVVAAAVAAEETGSVLDFPDEDLD